MWLDQGLWVTDQRDTSVYGRVRVRAGPQARSMADPDIQNILKDPIVQQASWTGGWAGG